MIAAFLLPFPVRGYRAPYLWLYYRLLHSFGERLSFIVTSDYLRPPESWAAEGRWEMQEISAHRLGYEIPTPQRMAEHDYGLLSDDVFAELLSAHGGNPVAVFKAMLTRRIPLLERALADALSSHPAAKLDAILTWCNCPSLNAVAEERGIRVMHLELGPLRWPDYRPTAYLDFTGVNGNTEAELRYLRSGFRGANWPTRRLRRFFANQDVQPRPADFDLGVVLQVEDDSNLIAFGNGFDNQSLLVHAQLNHSRQRRLVRTHPGSQFALRPGPYVVDESPNSIEFIQRCRRLLTINSSVGLEALLLDVSVKTLGDCSYRHVAEAEAHEQSGRLAHYLFAYLVPMDLIFSPAYLRFRLANPGEDQIVLRHIAAYLGNRAVAESAQTAMEAIAAVLPADGFSAS